MSVQEVMDLNALGTDGIDIGDTLRLRATPLKAAEVAPIVTIPALSPPAPEEADIVDAEPNTTSAAAASNDVPSETAEETPLSTDEDAEGLTAAQLVGVVDVLGDEESQGVDEANVTIPTPMTGSVNPLSRARLALAIALVVLGMITIHPRSRSLLLNRIPGLNLGTARGREVLAAIDLQASRRVGSNQQVMLLEVSGMRLLLGVSDGRMDVLHRWTDNIQDEMSPEMTSDLGADHVGGDSSDISPTVRQRAVPADQAARTPTLTPSAEELLDTWRDSVSEIPITDAPTSENMPWWMEGATSFEQAVLSEVEVESIRVDAPDGGNSPERDRVQESVLATLRDRRSSEASNVQTSERGMHDRAANSHGGFRAAARLGRQPRLGVNQQPAVAESAGRKGESTGTAPAGEHRANSASTMSFKL
jgi:flagellar biogenesis protein FliO